MSTKKAVATKPSKTTPQPLNPVRLNVFDCYTTEPPPRDFVFRGLLAGATGALIAPGGTGKSMLALNIGLAVATGFDLTNGALEVQNSGNVIYISAEDDQKELHHRLHDQGQLVPPDVRRLAGERFDVHCIKGIKGSWILDETGKPNPVAIDYLRYYSQGQRLIILDTLRRMHLADENNSGHMALFLAILEEIAAETDCTFLFLHHTSKYALFNGNGDQQGASRGSSVLVDNARYQANMVGMTTIEAKEYAIPEQDVWRYVRYVDAKVNYGAKGENIWLYRNRGGVLTRADITTWATKRSISKAGRVSREIED